METKIYIEHTTIRIFSTQIMKYNEQGQQFDHSILFRISFNYAISYRCYLLLIYRCSISIHGNITTK